jgi:hypothetical protein
MLGCFSFCVDDYVGRRMIVGFVFSSSPLPSRISKEFDPDVHEFSTSEFHQALNAVVGSGSSPLYFGFYRNEVGDSDPQHDGTPVSVELSLRLSMNAAFEPSTLTKFLESGNLNDEDPPVLSVTFSNANWLDEQKRWGYPMGDRDNMPFVPSKAEILVDAGRAAAMSFAWTNDVEEPFSFNPGFSPFSVVA